MTITIDVCWLDKIGNWIGKNSDRAKQLFVIGLVIASVPVFILGLLLMFEIVPEIFTDPSYTGERRDKGTAMLFIMAGGIGSIIFTFVLISTLQDMNREKHWFKIKHCDKNGDCK